MPQVNEFSWKIFILKMFLPISLFLLMYLYLFVFNFKFSFHYNLYFFKII